MTEDIPKNRTPANDVFKELDATADQLEDKIEAAKESLKTPEKKKMDTGVHAGIEFAGAIFIPTLIGWKLDMWLGTMPTFLLILFFLGVGTGFYSIYRITNNLGSSVGFSRLHQNKKDAKTQPNDKT